MRHFVELSLATVRAMHARGPLIYSAVHSLLLAGLHGGPEEPVCAKGARRQCQVFPPANDQLISSKTLQHRRNHVRVTDLRVFRRFCSSGSQQQLQLLKPHNNNEKPARCWSDTPERLRRKQVRARFQETTIWEDSWMKTTPFGSGRNDDDDDGEFSRVLLVYSASRSFFSSRCMLCVILNRCTTCQQSDEWTHQSDGREWAGTNESIFTEHGRTHTHTQAHVLVCTKTKRRHKWMNIWYGFGAGCCVRL